MNFEFERRDRQIQFGANPNKDGSYVVVFEASYSTRSEVVDFFTDIVELDNVRLETNDGWIKGTATAKNMFELELVAVAIYQEPTVDYLPEEAKSILELLKVVEG